MTVIEEMRQSAQTTTVGLSHLSHLTVVYFIQTVVQLLATSRHVRLHSGFLLVIKISLIKLPARTIKNGNKISKFKIHERKLHIMSLHI